MTRSRSVPEAERRALRRAYTGVWGTKVFWLALLTLLPLVIGWKLKALSLTLSPATIVYATYHGLGLYQWAIVRQLTEQPKQYTRAEAAAAWSGITRRHRVVRPLSWIVLVLVSLSIAAKADLVWQSKTYQLDLPRWVYPVLGVPAGGPSRRCQQMRSKLRLVKARRPARACPVPGDATDVVLAPTACLDNRGAKPCVFDLGQPVTDARLGPLWKEVWDLYRAVNPGLIERISRLADRAGASDRSGLLWVQAPAGAGKSFLFQGLYPEDESRRQLTGKNVSTKFFRHHDDAWLRQVNLRAMYDDLETPDLVLHGRVVNPLKGSVATETDRATTLSRIEATLDDVRTDDLAHEVLILDAFDELHPDVREVLRERVERFLAEYPGNQAVIIGRPESMPRVTGGLDKPFDIDRVEVAFPPYDDLDAIAMRWNNWIYYRAKHHGIPPDRNTRFADVVELLRRSPTVCISFPHLSTSGAIISLGHEWIRDNGRLAGEAEIQSALFGALLERNTETHQRPKVSEQEYVSMLSEFVISYLEFLPDGSDFFHIKPESRFGADGPHAQELLDHSGLIDIRPADTRAYRFFPPWVGEELIRRQARLERCDLD